MAQGFGQISTRRLVGLALVTNATGQLLMVNRPTGALELPGGEAILEEPAVRSAAYHLRRLGLAKQPGPILAVDHMEALPLGVAGDTLTVVFHCGTLTPAEVSSLNDVTLPDDVKSCAFVDPTYFHPGIARYHRRCLEAAVSSLNCGTGTPYLRNGLRINAQLPVLT
ncbi:hypothetical protein [Streptomyces roseoverticillatus]|uniref:hypothetical protein n=1 Tax=Streptomyces roseoverticillatus TaxID=66429 RepID=UPI0012FE9198|nr:hypothetical protein [Streptomyces roseoverticillatus]